MNRVNPKLRDFAVRLIAYEAKECKSSGTQPTAAFPVAEKLRPHLATLMGTFGFRSLLSRSLALASTEVPWLGSVEIKADGSLPRLDELAAKVAPADISEGRVALLTQLLGLLVAFIGANLTLQLVHEAWPNLPRRKNDLNLN
jgi:hypothetical protein